MRELIRSIALLLALAGSARAAATVYLMGTTSAFTPLSSASINANFGNTNPGCQESAPPYNFFFYSTATSAGSSVVTNAFTPRNRTAATDDPPCWFQKGDTNAYLAWVTPPLSADVTISGNVDYQVGAAESNGNLNACVDVLVLWWSKALGGIKGVIDDSNSAGEIGTSLANQVIAAHAPSGGSSAMKAGDRFIIVPRLQTGTTTCGSGTFGGNGTRTASVGVAAAVGVAGHSFMHFVSDTPAFGSDVNDKGNGARLGT